MTDDKGIKPRTWSALAAGALLIAIALGLILYWATKDPLTAFAAILLVFGVYMAATSFARKGREDSFGPSDADAALAGGIIVAGLGVTCLVYAYSDSVLVTAAVFIIIIAVVGMAMAVKNRNVRSCRWTKP